ncbi:MAG: hypothetical protein ABMA25_08595, partial [Ilumatobacteraceae bacterium]
RTISRPSRLPAAAINSRKLAGPAASVSATDFLLFDLPPLRDRLARDYEGQTLPTDDDAVRVCISRGVLVQSVALFAQLAVDDAVEVWLSIDLG